MNSTNLYLRMNNYFKTDLQIDEVIDYLQNPKSENNFKKNKHPLKKIETVNVFNFVESIKTKLEEFTSKFELYSQLESYYFIERYFLQ